MYHETPIPRETMLVSGGNRKDHLRIQQCFGGRGGEKSLSFGHLKGMS